MTRSMSRVRAPSITPIFVSKLYKRRPEMESMVFDVVIEIPAGSRNKYEINKDNHLLLIWNKGLGRIQLWVKIN